FLDRVATMTIAMEGDGKAVVYAGGWSDYRLQKGVSSPEKVDKTKTNEQKIKRKNIAKPGLSFTEQHRLEALPDEMKRIEVEIAKLENLMADPALFTREPVKFSKATKALVQRQQKLAAAEEEWLTLEEKAENAT
ncbi:MAG: ABC transporter ATP-binding protein, partial [Rhodobacteraceae bacterium]|nr:ABC transporter ATP-binding protein [Paracoccaceae bacterium]